MRQWMPQRQDAMCPPTPGTVTVVPPAPGREHDLVLHPIRPSFHAFAFQVTLASAYASQQGTQRQP